MISCAGVQTAGQNVLDCEAQDAPQTISDQVSSALSGQDNSWQSALDKLLLDQGPVVVCAVEKEVALLEHSAMRNGATQIAYVRGRMWLSSENHLAMVKH